MNAPPRPVGRRLDATIETTIGVDTLVQDATVDLFDCGESDHVGYLWIAGQHMPVRLQGVKFAPRKLAGRPSRTARDVAVYLACAWFEQQGKPKVAESVVDLWQGFKGFADAAHVRRARKRGDEFLGQGAAVLVNAGVDGLNPGGSAWIAPDAKIDDAGVHGAAWVWDHGDEEARFGILTIRRR